MTSNYLVVALKRQPHQGFSGTFLRTVGYAVDEALQTRGINAVFDLDASKDISKTSWDQSGYRNQAYRVYDPNYVAFAFRLTEAQVYEFKPRLEPASLHAAA